MTTSDPGSPAIATAPGLAVDRSGPVSANPATAVFGQVMGLVPETSRVILLASAYSAATQPSAWGSLSSSALSRASAV